MEKRTKIPPVKAGNAV